MNDAPFGALAPNPFERAIMALTSRMPDNWAGLKLAMALRRLVHDEPNIVHVGRPGEGIIFKPGMLFTVEPMINLGRPHVKVLSDGWTAVTRDRSLSAQFEHSVGVTDRSVEIFTLSPKGLDRPPYARS